MKKINWSVIGMVVSVCVVVLGILTLVGTLGGVPANDDTFFDSSTSGYARFGTDFYTYVNNNAASAALYSIRTTALLRNVSGFMFISFGLLSFCYFASKRSLGACASAKPEYHSAENENQREDRAESPANADENA